MCGVARIPAAPPTGCTIQPIMTKRKTIPAWCFLTCLGVANAASPKMPTFFARRDYAGLHSTRIAVGDTNGDGIPDLINSGNSIIQVLLTAARREAELPPTRRAVVAGIQAEVLVRSPCASLVLIRWRSGRGDPLPIPGAFPFRTAQPGEMGVQNVDVCGRGLLWQRGWRRGFRQCGQEGAAGALVAGGGPAAAGAQLAQLLW